MEKNNKLGTKLLVLSVLSAFYPAAFADDDDNGETLDVTQTIHLNEFTKPNDLVKEDFINDFLQGTSLKKGAITTGETIGEGGFGIVSEATDQDGNKLVVKRPHSKKSPGHFQTRKLAKRPQAGKLAKRLQTIQENYATPDEYARSQAMIRKARKLINTSNVSNIHGQLLGLGVIVPVIGQTADGGIIQEYANGVNLLETADSSTKDYLIDWIHDVIDEDLGDKDEATIELVKCLIDDVIEKKLARSSGSTKLEKVLAKDLIQETENEIDDPEIKKSLRDLIYSTTGRDLLEEINTIIAESHDNFFDIRGFPKDPQKAIQALCSFFHSLVTLQALEYVHCDIKTENVILTKDHILKLIDLGGLTKINENITIHSGSGAPETLYASELRIPQSLTAQPAYDIYCSAGVILGCLFGNKGIEADTEYFWPNENNDAPVYIQHLIKNPEMREISSAARAQLFNEMIDPLNRAMGRQIPDPQNPNQMITVGNYPPYVLNQIKAILAWVTDFNPQDRPSAIEVLELLQELALSDWNDTSRPEVERYQIDTRPIMKKQTLDPEDDPRTVPQQQRY